MCQSAFIEPKGPATLGLARYYLGIRALDQAERWAKRAIEVNPRAQRSAQQLLGDVLCQRGQMKEAREIWLSSFGLKADDERRISAVVRRFEKAARAARRGGDAPLAETHLRRAAAFDPKSADTAADLASILVKNEQPGLAKIWADKALELDSTSKEAKEVLSELSR
jgi:tetratricopeptide (TPR) repeat protein